MKIVLTGGGTGGHIIPLIAVARKIKEKEIATEFMFLGPKENFSKKFMTAEGITIKHAMSGKMRRYFSILNFVDALKIPIGIVQALWHLLWFMPEAIFSKGGCATLPVVIAGWLYHIPILIHESDANPGMANSVLAKLVSRVAVSYPSAESYFHSEQVVVTGSPLRENINKGNKENAQKMFSLLESKKTIFVWGGSQGAKAINDKILEVLPELLPNYQIIHQTGEKNFEEVKKRAGELGIKIGRDGYHILSFIGEELKDILAVTDLVISRAGSSSISEIAANGKPAIIIPIENSANDHQRMNAYSIAKIGGCVVLEESNLGEHMLLGKINEIMNNEELRNKLIQNIKSFYHPDAADRIAEGILGMVR
ncbi:MAG: undecaprenyldiphospho-muramoylpentapeptide beta-N-acetylglucosaminyltransferase [Candidatus Moranbacteria bacterium CG23_combo_of_CG06-09_8_20_14_all_35_22]|nr:MAG: undecaprenyldiphospho-muramoylpentapeptide beta-N-acetylglucosaminyltransferase [Candidatus Moranbacteria bacterium CG23_combo_of_CG06-09_8_20_14_all_35_22]